MALWGCATPAPSSTSAPDRAKPPVAAETVTAKPPTSIAFSASPCYGWCPDFTVTVTASGAVTFEGRRFAALSGVHQLPEDQALFTELSEIVTSEALPWPAGDVMYSSPLCQMMINDLPEYRLSVEGATGTRGFAYYSGCGGPQANRARQIVDRVMASLRAHNIPTESTGPEAPMQPEAPPVREVPTQ